MSQSPASSPRLPSPPPMAEDQTGPVSPASPGVPFLEEQEKARFDTASSASKSSRRIRPGSKGDDISDNPRSLRLDEIDSSFPLTEYLHSLYHSLTIDNASSPSFSTTIPLNRPLALQLCRAPTTNTDRTAWLYELCRLLVSRTNLVLIALFSSSSSSSYDDSNDDDASTPCSAITCPEMRASEWQYLCAAHDPPKSCSAIDYACHTLDWCAIQLTSSKIFPRPSTDNTTSLPIPTQTQQLRKMTEIFRRVYRIFAHTWFQHREIFWKVESRTGLYVFFKTVCDEYKLIPEDNYTVPAEAEGLDVQDDIKLQKEDNKIQVLKRDGEMNVSLVIENGIEAEDDDNKKKKIDTQKRHHRAFADRHGSVSTVIHEEVEDEDTDHGQSLEPQEGVSGVLSLLKRDDDDERSGDQNSVLDLSAQSDLPRSSSHIHDDKSHVDEGHSNDMDMYPQKNVDDDYTFTSSITDVESMETGHIDAAEVRPNDEDKSSGD